MRKFKNILHYLRSQVAIHGVVYDVLDDKDFQPDDVIILTKRGTWAEIDYVCKNTESVVVKCDCGMCSIEERTHLMKHCKKLKEIKYWEN